MIPYVESAILIFFYMTFLFIFNQVKKDNSLVDIGWGLGFILVAWFSLFQAKIITLPHLIATFLVTIWGVRLATHIYKRHSGEDWRYREWRKKWKFFYIRSFFQIYMLQGFFLYLISLPLIYLAISNETFSWVLLVLGVLIFVSGFTIESIADRQLDKFIKFKKSQNNPIMKTGLWKYSRHPNYFGEALLWWGIFIIAFSATFNFWLIVSPLIITILVRFVSGVPMLERKFENNPHFIKYKEKTSTFIPLPPRK